MEKVEQLLKPSQRFTMQEKSHTKQITGAKNKAESKNLSARDAYIIEQSKKGFTPTEILTLMKREGFVPIARSRIYQILERIN